MRHQYYQWGVEKTQQIWNHHETPCSLGALHFLHLMTTIRVVLPPHVSCTGCCMSHTATEWGQEEMEIYPTKYPFYEQGWLRSGEVSDLSGLCPHIPHSPTQHLAQCFAYSGLSVNATCFEVGRTASKERNLHKLLFRKQTINTYILKLKW